MWETIIPAVISAAGSAGGGFISSAGASAANQQNAWLARDAQQFNERMAHTAMAFTERMSNTAYQRAMADMRAAGLNPMLAYQQGGASSPAGTSASSPVAQMENAMEGIGQGVTSASKVGERALELRNLMSQTDNTISQTGVNKAVEDLRKVESLKTVQDTKTSAANEQRAAAETALTMEQMQNPAAARALMASQGHSAYHAGELSKIQTHQLKEFGPGKIAQEIGSPGSRILNWLRENGAKANQVPKGTDIYQDPGSRGWNRNFNPDGSLRR